MHHAHCVSHRMAVAWLIALFTVPMPFVAVLAVFIAPVYREMMMTPITLGIIAYVWMLESVYLSCRPHWLDRLIGLPHMYVMHGTLGMMALLLAALHRVDLPAYGLPKTLGDIAFWLMVVLAILALMFMARPVADRVPPIGWLRRKLEHTFRHEFTVWLHRILLVAVICVWAHFHLIRYIARVLPFTVLVDCATIAVLGCYAYRMTREQFCAWHGKVTQCRTIAPNVVELSIRISAPRTSTSWEEGDFAFIRFPSIRGMREYHPFSMVNAPDGTGVIRFAIRADGDFTRRLPSAASPGTTVDLLPPFGRYRRFLDEHEASRPIIIYAGGIGVTPLLPVIFHYGARNRRRITMLYSARTQSGLLYQNELSTWQQATGNTSMLKAGQFTAEELRHAITTDALYLIAGPAAMTRAITKLLRKADVPANDICYEPFSF